MSDRGCRRPARSPLCASTCATRSGSPRPRRSSVWSSTRLPPPPSSTTRSSDCSSGNRRSPDRGSTPRALTRPKTAETVSARRCTTCIGALQHLAGRGAGWPAAAAPRVVRIFVRSRISKLTLTVFLATFLLSLLVLSSYESETDPRRVVSVPLVQSLLILVLVGTSLVLFVVYVSATLRLMQVGPASTGSRGTRSGSSAGCRGGLGGTTRWSPRRRASCTRGGPVCCGTWTRRGGPGCAAAGCGVAADRPYRGLRRAGDAGARRSRRGRAAPAPASARPSPSRWSAPCTRIWRSGCDSSRTSRCGRSPRP
ncbi:hypothetical protein SBADM41S_03128 [Streptomyces badius]